MTRTLCLLLLLSVFAVARADNEVMGHVNDDGLVVIRGESVELLGLDLISEGGFLIPPPDEDASPFSFFLTNSSTQITYVNLGTPVVLDGELVLNAAYGDGSGFGGDLAGTWGGLDSVGSVTASVALPEPERAGLLLPLVIALLLRRRRID